MSQGFKRKNRKVRRTSQACSHCSQRKVRCNGELPCSNCQRRGEMCLYGFTTRKNVPFGLTVTSTVKKETDENGLAVSAEVPNYSPLSKPNVASGLLSPLPLSPASTTIEPPPPTVSPSIVSQAISSLALNPHNLAPATCIIPGLANLAPPIFPQPIINQVPSFPFLNLMPVFQPPLFDPQVMPPLLFPVPPLSGHRIPLPPTPNQISPSILGLSGVPISPAFPLVHMPFLPTVPIQTAPLISKSSAHPNLEEEKNELGHVLSEIDLINRQNLLEALAFFNNNAYIWATKLVDSEKYVRSIQYADKALTSLLASLHAKANGDSVTSLKLHNETQALLSQAHNTDIHFNTVVLFFDSCTYGESFEMNLEHNWVDLSQLVCPSVELQMVHIIFYENKIEMLLVHLRRLSSMRRFMTPLSDFVENASFSLKLNTNITSVGQIGVQNCRYDSSPELTLNDYMDKMNPAGLWAPKP
eukprot:TRINITY_DN468_c0_g1_i1.p1 TRINITY_DN468_c0_g1~~TRINITY_DN468_c0_g1_i1.p1  ORF type:complete len:471 (-),score=31.24 TRINITY_DN468_c0_g1_i1:50-1462(-)